MTLNSKNLALILLLTSICKHLSSYRYKPKSPRDWFLRDGSQGCVREENRSMCRNKEGFLKLASVKLPDTSKAEVNKSLTFKECKEECLKNCSCIGYISDEGSSCISLHGQLMDTRMYPSGGQDVYFRADAVELGMISLMLWLSFV